MTGRIVPAREAEEVRTDLLSALIRGEVVHHDDLRHHYNDVRLRLDLGIRLRSRTDGKGGRYYWTEQIDD